MPSQDEVKGFQAIIGRLAALAGDTAATIMREIEEAERADVYPAAVEGFLDASSLISAEWYNSLSDAPFTAEPAPVADAETLGYKVDWAATEPDPPQALKDATDRLVFTASRDTVVDNAEREGVRYARHASEDACPWCSILAMRGPVYHSADTATKSHDACKCVAVPVRDGDSYTEPEYVEDWRSEYQNARDETGSKNMDDIVNSMRRARHHDDPEANRAYAREYYEANKENITARQRKRYANTKNVT
jgi:hypothetical protein